MKKELINHVTHEFRSPLFSIQSAVDILADIPSVGEENEARRIDYLEMVRKTRIGWASLWMSFWIWRPFNSPA